MNMWNLSADVFLEFSFSFLPYWRPFLFHKVFRTKKICYLHAKWGVYFYWTYTRKNHHDCCFLHLKQIFKLIPTFSRSYDVILTRCYIRMSLLRQKCQNRSESFVIYWCKKKCDFLTWLCFVEVFFLSKKCDVK